jgi:hypothetical protein
MPPESVEAGSGLAIRRKIAEAQTWKSKDARWSWSSKMNL